MLRGRSSVSFLLTFILLYRFEQFCYEYNIISLNFSIDSREERNSLAKAAYTALDLLILHQSVSPVHTILPYAIILTVHYREVK